MSDIKSGLFISLEGPEGSGKSTNALYITDLLKQQKISVKASREPGGTNIGESLRNLLLAKETGNLSGETELLMMFAARLEHVNQLIKPTLKSGSWLLCDRFTASSYAYQGGGRGLELEKIAQLEQWCLADFRPDLTLVFDVSVETTLKRITNRGSLDRFEDQEIEFFYRVKETFLQLAKDQPQRYRVIDANQPLDQVQKEVSDILEPIIKQWQSSSN